jgi:hypothetical protein
VSAIAGGRSPGGRRSGGSLRPRSRTAGAALVGCCGRVVDPVALPGRRWGRSRPDGLTDGGLAADAQRLEERRLTCLERRVDLDLLERHADLTALATKLGALIDATRSGRRWSSGTCGRCAGPAGGRRRCAAGSPTSSG